tara:strand:+ start:2284 stop:2415 length:132 start_codon:yes stop_codon:yes gene_type:complete
MNTEPQNNDEIVWDIEDIKKAFVDSAKDYQRIMKELDEKTSEN